MNSNQPKPFLLRNLKWVSSALAIICILWMYFIRRPIDNSEYFIIRFIPFIVIFLIIPVFELIALVLFTKRFTLSFGIAVVSIFVIGFTSGLYQEHLEKVELNQYGIWTKSVVTNNKPVAQKGGGRAWLIMCRYKANGQVFNTFYHTNANDKYKVGDTIRLIYSSKDPKIYTLEFEWKK